MADRLNKFKRLLDARHGVPSYRVPTLVVVALGGLAISLGLFVYASAGQRQTARLAFARNAEDRVAIIRGHLDQTFEKIHTLADAMRRRPDMNDALFKATVKPWLERQPFIRALGYVKRVPGDRREVFEPWASQRGFSLFDYGPEGGRRPAVDRPVHFPVIHINFRGSNPHEARGFDAAGSPERMRAIERARDTGEMAISEAVRLIGLDGNRAMGVVGWEPIYAGGLTPPTMKQRREKLVGLAAASVQLRDLVYAGLDPARPGGVNLWLFDVTGKAPAALPPQPIDPATGRRPISYAALLARPLVYHTTLAKVNGRTWEAVCTPSAAYLASSGSLAPWAIFGAGLLGTALVLALLSAQAIYGDRLAQRYAAQREADQALSRANRRLQAVNTEMEQFVSAVSHDLKSPLITTAMLVEMLEREADKGRTDQIMEAAGHIATTVRRMHRIVDNLIQHNRAGWSTLQRAEVDLRDLALDVADDHREDAKARGVRLDVQDAMPTILADRGWLLTALNNLVSNALKYGCDKDDPRILIGCEPHDQHVRLWVHDNGSGIEEEQREKVFDLFTRFSRNAEGTGIGLATVQRVAQAHGGRAWVECPSDEGCLFYIQLPCQPPAAEPE